MSYPEIQLSEIDVSALRPIKELVLRIGRQDHTRWVFRAPRGRQILDGRDVYLKIWNPGYIRRDNLLRAIDAGFYDQQTVPALRAVICSNGVCRGYILDRCRENSRLDHDFYRLIKTRTFASGYFHVQFSPYHTMRYRQGYSLIDLEGVHRIADLPLMPSLHCRFDWPDYERYVAELYASTFWSRQALPVRPGATPAASSRLIRGARVPYRKARALVMHVRRLLIHQFGARARHTHLIER